jgi:hypothetical protein
VGGGVTGLAVVLAALAVVVTKALDGATTLRRIGPDGAGESNPVARAMMQRLGVRTAVVGVCVFAAVWAVLLAGLVLASGVAWLQLGYVVTALFVAVVQAAVARTNATGRANSVTRRVIALHGRMRRAIAGVSRACAWRASRSAAARRR